MQVVIRLQIFIPNSGITISTFMKETFEHWTEIDQPQ